MMRRARPILLAAAVVAVTARVTHAQSVHGTVVDGGNRPVAGVVILVVDSVSRIAGRALTAPSGEFRLSVPSSGTYRLQTRRIGFRPSASEPVALAMGADVAHNITISDIALGLDTVRIAGQNICRGFADSGAATYAIWEQIRTALIATELTAGARSTFATTVSYDRTIDTHPGNKILQQRANVVTGYVSRAWRTLSPDSLHRIGYVAVDRDNTVTYYAPGLDMLTSPVFIGDHCFKLVSDAQHANAVGIAFEPTPERRRIPEIRGTIWVDRTSSELDQLAFRYANVSTDQADYAGGTLRFARMRNNAWVTTRWEIRMPVVEEVVVPGHGTETRVPRLQVAGGLLALAWRGTDTLWSGPRYALVGQLLDSSSGAGVRAGRVLLPDVGREATSDERGHFEIANLFPSTYTVDVHTTSLDSLGAVHRAPVTLVDSATIAELRVPNGRQLATTLCGTTAGIGSRGSGIVTGKLVLPSSGAADLHGGRVVAEWRDDSTDAARTQRIGSSTAPDGSFRLCGLPANTPISVHASTDSAESAAPVVVRVSSAVRLTRTDLPLERTRELAARGATFAGIVISDSTHLPIVAAEIAFPELGKTVLADSEGRFRVLGIPAGNQHLVVRRLGYGAAEATVPFAAHEIVERRIVLGQAISLSAVVVSEREVDRTMPGFEENRRVGLGSFLTRQDLEKFAGMRLATALQQTRGFGMVDGRGHQWPTSRRAPLPLCGNADYEKCMNSQGFYIPSPQEIAQGMRTACYAQVYIDGVLMNGGHEPTDPFDIGTLAPEQVEAIEYYASPAETPLKYSRMASTCGVLVIWRRRS